MGVRLALLVLVLVGLVAVPGASTLDPARAFLTAAFNLSPANISLWYQKRGTPCDD